MKKSSIIWLVALVSILGLLSCSKSKDTSSAQFSGIKVRVSGTEYTWPQAQYQFIIEKVVTGGVTSYKLRTRTPSSPEVNSIDFNIPTSSFTPAVYDPRNGYDHGLLVKINRTIAAGYHLFPNYTAYGSTLVFDVQVVLSAKSNSLCTGSFSSTCVSLAPNSSTWTSSTPRLAVAGDFINIPILE